MKRSILVAAGVLLISALAAGGAWAFGARDVAKMHKDGIADSLIIQKIQYSGTVFHLQPGDLRELKKAGVSDEVVSVMLATEQKPKQQDANGHYYYPYGYPYGPYYYPRVVVGLGFYGHYGYGSYYHGFYPRPYPYAYGRPGYYGYPGYRGYPGRGGYPGGLPGHPGGGRYK